MADTRIRIVLADDHALLAEGVRLNLEPEYAVVGAATDGRELIAKVHDLRPDLVVTDIAMPSVNGLQAIDEIVHHPAGPRVVVLSMYSDQFHVRAAFAVGASGYVLKSAHVTELKDAIRQVLSGGTYISPAIPLESDRNYAGLTRPRALTRRQREVLQLIAEGRRAREIAQALNISVKTVEFHRASLSDTLGLRTVAELTRYAIEAGIAATGLRMIP